MFTQYPREQLVLPLCNDTTATLHRARAKSSERLRLGEPVRISYHGCDPTRCYQTARAPAARSNIAVSRHARPRCTWRSFVWRSAMADLPSAPALGGWSPLPWEISPFCACWMAMDASTARHGCSSPNLQISPVGCGTILPSPVPQIIRRLSRMVGSEIHRRRDRPRAESSAPIAAL